LPDLKTEVSEIATALGMLDFPTIDAALASEPSEIRNVSTLVWNRLKDARRSRLHEPVFEAAWQNGRVFLEADDALRGRRPKIIEWKGPTRPVGYEAVPADLRVDHVYLISCKHRSRILHNVAPGHLFDRLLVTRRGGSVPDWYLSVGGEAYQRLYEVVRAHVRIPALPLNVRDLSRAHRRALIAALPARVWPEPLVEEYRRFAHKVAEATAAIWNENLDSSGAKEEQYWRLLRHSSAPYFLLGVTSRGSLRFRIAAPWDWRQHFRFLNLSVAPDLAAGQPLVRWEASVRRIADNADVVVRGIVEIRWSHGKFRAPPEAKVQLETSLADAPGYFGLS